MWFLYQSKEDIQKFVDKFGQDAYDIFLKNKQRLASKGYTVDITVYVKNCTVDRFWRIIDQVQKKVVKDSSGKIKNNAIKVAENENYIVYDVLDWQTSMNMGQGTCWCITGRYNTGGQVKPSQAKQFFDRYKSQGVKFYLFCMPKNSSLQKYCIVVYSNDRYQCWDSSDNDLGEQFPNKLPPINYKGFENKPLVVDPNVFNVVKVAENEDYTVYDVLDWQTAYNLGDDTLWRVSGVINKNRDRSAYVAKKKFYDLKEQDSVDFIFFCIPKKSSLKKYCIFANGNNFDYEVVNSDNYGLGKEIPPQIPSIDYKGFKLQQLVYDPNDFNVVKVAQNDNYVVYDALDWQTAVNLGQGTIWEISGRNRYSDNLLLYSARDSFNQHKEDNHLNLFCIPKKSQFKKYLIECYTISSFFTRSCDNSFYDYIVPQQVPSIDYKGFKWEQPVYDPNAFNVNKLAENQYYTAYQILDWQTAVNLGCHFWEISKRECIDNVYFDYAETKFKNILNNDGVCIFYVEHHSKYASYYCIAYDNSSCHLTFRDINNKIYSLIDIPQQIPSINCNGIQVSPTVIKDASNLDITNATLLTVEQVEKLPIMLKTYTFNWWTRSPGQDSSYAYGVLGNSTENFNVKRDLDIRPALKISNLEQSGLKVGDGFEFGEKFFKIISNDTAFCFGGVTSNQFNLDESDGNDYQTSYIKKIVDGWFNIVKREQQKNLSQGFGNGYDGYSMSNNARQAYNLGQKPMSKWTKAEILDAVKQINPGVVDALRTVNVSILRDKLLTKSSWHHTSMYYNKTSFYSIDEDTVQELTVDQIDGWQKKPSVGLYKPQQKTYRGDFEYIQWQGTRKHPKAVEHRLTDVNITEKGSFYIVTDDNGNQLIRKMIGSNGTYAIKK